MESKIFMLGTGNGSTKHFFNTCFVIHNEEGDFLIDTGGSIELLNRLEYFNVDFRKIKNIFISHSHADHVLGLMWYFKSIIGYLMKNNPNEKIKIFCNKEVYDSIIKIAENILQEIIVESIKKYFDFIVLNDGDIYKINGVKYEFFDIYAKGFRQFGFEGELNNKRFIFLGDETIDNKVYERVKNADFVAHEAFCLDSEEKIFHPYEKNHSTVKSSCEIMEKLRVKKLMLYHTEETHGSNRKKLYLEEADKHFSGKCIIPDDFEIIEI